MRYMVDSSATTQFHITGKGKNGRIGSIRLFQNGVLFSEAYFKFPGYETFFLIWDKYTLYDVELDNLEVSLAYRFDPERVLECGVEFMEFGQELRLFNKNHLLEVFCQQYRNSFHFSPFKGWMNDPNGLCWFKGYYHLFYQYNPNDQKWGNMHWGHGVSKDLLHWTHLPIAAYPQIELNGCDGWRGGAFSGSAVVADDAMHLFYTRHFGKTDRSIQRQWQVTKESKDGICFTHEECCIWGTPEGVDWNFRDPKVTYIENQWIMVIGGTCYGRPSVMQYRSNDLKHWEYAGILYQENDTRYGIAECPDFFLIDGKCVLIVGYINKDPENTERDTLYYIGTYEQGKFVVESRGMMDYGKDFYAAQTFSHEGRRVCLGWNRCAEGVHIEEEGGANGSLSLPRELSIENGRLVGRVITEVQILLCDAEESGPYYLRAEVAKEGTAQMDLLLAKGISSALRLYINEREIRLILEKENDETGFACTFAGDSPVKLVEAYVDQSLIELYINGGRQVCTKRFYIDRAVLKPVLQEGSFCIAEYKRIRSIWQGINPEIQDM